jgi:hypothetical protein
VPFAKLIAMTDTPDRSVSLLAFSSPVTFDRLGTALGTSVFKGHLFNDTSVTYVSRVADVSRIVDVQGV